MCKTEPAAKFGIRKTDEINERQYSLLTYVKKGVYDFFGFTWRKTRKQAIRSINGTRSVNWCRDKLHRTINNNRKKVILALKLKVVIDQNKRVYIWRRPDEIWRQECPWKRKILCPVLGLCHSWKSRNIYWNWRQYQFPKGNQHFGNKEQGP